MVESVRIQLQRRLGGELSDEALADQIATTLPESLIRGIEEMTQGHIATSVLLNYRPDTVPADEVTTLWAFAYGYRLAPGVEPKDGVIPPRDELLPGPVNVALAQQIAAFVQAKPIPIVAQWEVADVLATLGVSKVISVDPDVDADGAITYLSTLGVAEKGLRLAEEAEINLDTVGVLGHADHAARCLVTAGSAGMSAGVPDNVDLPTLFDPESGQAWTRDRATWIIADLFARTATATGAGTVGDAQSLLRQLRP